jgi:hypothetical protein
MRRRNVLTVAFVVFLPPPAGAEDISLSAAIGLLDRERSYAESEAGLLKHYAAPDDVEGRRLYALARADFDGLITELLSDLAQHQDPSVQDAFQAALRDAVTARLAFTHYADGILAGAVPKGAKPAAIGELAEALAKSVPDLVAALIDGGISIWREWRGASQDRRDDIKTRLESVRWKPFADIPPAA